MRHISMALETISLAIGLGVTHLPIQVIDCGFVAAQAIFLDYLSRRFFGTDCIRDIAQHEGRYMMITRLGFNQIFGDQSVRGMAIVAIGPRLVAAVVPSLVGVIHHVTIIASRWVVAQVSRKVGHIQTNS
jgi:hypothetical protein